MNNKKFNCIGTVKVTDIPNSTDDFVKLHCPILAQSPKEALDKFIDIIKVKNGRGLSEVCIVAKDNPYLENHKNDIIHFNPHESLDKTISEYFKKIAEAKILSPNQEEIGFEEDLDR